MGDRKTVEKIFSSYHCCNLAEEDRNKKVGIAIVGLVFSSLLDILISQWHMQEYNPQQLSHSAGLPKAENVFSQFSYVAVELQYRAMQHLLKQGQVALQQVGYIQQNKKKDPDLAGI